MAQTFQLKGSLFTLSVLQLLSNDLDLLDKQLAEKVKLAPKFFQNAPIVLDIQALSEASELDFEKLVKILRQHTLVPVGVRGGAPGLQTKAQAAGLATMIDSAVPVAEPAKVQKPKKETPARETTNPQPIAYPNEVNALMITQPVRSGQQIYSQGDLIVLNSVSPGAELLAEGNIHVYGTLRGRALAGIGGNSMSRLFCSKLEAELVAIAGHYKVFEEIPGGLTVPQQIYLDNDQLLIRPL